MFGAKGYGISILILVCFPTHATVVVDSATGPHVPHVVGELAAELPVVYLELRNNVHVGA